MELAYLLSALCFGFLCFCVGVNQGAKYAVKRITEEL
jgi:hypothetical protein